MSDMSSVPPPPPPPPGGSFTPPPPPPPTAAPGAGGDRTLWLILSYLWFVSIVPWVMRKDDPEIQWHAKNGFVFACAITAVDVFFFILGHFMPLVACLVSVVPCALAVGYLVVVIVGIVKAINGQRFRVPGLSDFADKL